MVVLPIRVKTGADSNRVQVMSDGRLKVFVKARPEKGKANDEVIRVLADFFSLARSAVQIKAGLASSDKQVAIEGLDASAVQRKADLLRR